MGTQSLDDALQTSLHGLFSTQPTRLETFLHPENSLLTAGGTKVFDQMREQLQSVSTIRVSSQTDRLDGSVDLSIELAHPEGGDEQAPTSLIAHMRPVEGGWRLDQLASVRKVPQR